jgi:hypothetical protein
LKRSAEGKVRTWYFSLELIGNRYFIRAHEDDERRAEENEAQRQLREKAYVENGVWVTPILFKPDAKKLSNNYSMALKRFHNMERKLEMDPQLEKDYDEGDKGVVRARRRALAPPRRNRRANCVLHAP